MGCTRVLLASCAPTQCELLRPALEQAGCAVVGVCDDAQLEGMVRSLKPDAVLIHSDSPARDTLEHLAALHRNFPCPIVALCEGGHDATAARAAAEMGLSLYLNDGISPLALAYSLHVAAHQHRQQRGLREQLRELKLEMEERRIIDRAKCWLIERQRLTESEAYHQLRRAAMNQNERLVKVARDLLAAAGEAV